VNKNISIWSGYIFNALAAIFYGTKWSGLWTPYYLLNMPVLLWIF